MLETLVFQNFKKHILLFVIIISTVACDSQSSKKSSLTKVKTYCGYELSVEEFSKIAEETFGNYNPYSTKNSSEIFLEIYNTLKNQLDSSIEYELTLVKIKSDEIWLDLKVPKDNKNIEKIGCILMNSDFSSQVPKQIKVRIFEWEYSTPNFREEKILIEIKQSN